MILDSHALIWAVDDPVRLSANATAEMQNSANELLLSAATVWEIAIKVGLRKLNLTMAYRQWMDKAIADLGIVILPITVEYADAQAQLPLHHRDPFDRLMIAQAVVEGLPLISSDGVLDVYGVVRVW